MTFRSLTLATLLALLTGCAATVKRDAGELAATRLPPTASAKLVLNVGGSKEYMLASDWEAFKAEWKEYFGDKAAAAGIPFEMQSGTAKPTGDEGTLLAVHVEDYRFLRPGTRYAIGVFSGNAYIESKLKFIDLKTGDVYGTQSANTSSSAWEGAFSAMTNKQIEAIANGVFAQLAGSKASSR